MDNVRLLLETMFVLTGVLAFPIYHLAVAAFAVAIATIIRRHEHTDQLFAAVILCVGIALTAGVISVQHAVAILGRL